MSTRKRGDATIYPVGARVLVDGQYEAIIAQAFPEGSSSFAFPHYKVHIVGGDQNVAVSMKRINVDSRIIISRGKVIGQP